MERASGAGVQRWLVLCLWRHHPPKKTKQADKFQEQISEVTSFPGMMEVLVEVVGDPWVDKRSPLRLLGSTGQAHIHHHLSSSSSPGTSLDTRNRPRGFPCLEMELETSPLAVLDCGCAGEAPHGELAQGAPPG